MQIALVPPTWSWALGSFPTAHGLATAVRWIRYLMCPLVVDERGLVLGYHRRVDWRSMRKIGVSRSYFDGHVSEIRIYHANGTSKVSVHSLRNGEEVARTILTTFEQANKARVREHRLEANPDRGPFAACHPGDIPVERPSALAREHRVRNSLARGQERVRRALQRANDGIMTTLLGSVHEIEAAAACPALITNSNATFDARPRALWPGIIVPLGLGLSAAWTAGLCWLLYVIV